eukprot:NODE_1164_length_482_cov_182.754930_g1154_i0.p1 GENE.NODE_1164_length_482_cov_182.754930_g1154_i0~~NODE_1164_length_482_cov_182.754930_g1154_i0.p1  ORF type:complete len:84 (-),score=9.03 NODE_1164_length_482_cov_182.754930_g1154_i0:195-446(-)
MKHRRQKSTSFSGKSSVLPTHRRDTHAMCNFIVPQDIMTMRSGYVQSFPLKSVQLFRYQRASQPESSVALRLVALEHTQTRFL